MDEEDAYESFDAAVQQVFTPSGFGGIAHSERATPQLRNAKGQFDQKLTAEYKQVLASAGQMIKGYVLDNYDRSGLGTYTSNAYNQTGELRQAVEASTVTVDVSTKTFNVTVALGNAEQQRSVREGQGYASPTFGQIGRWMFGGMNVDYIVPRTGQYLHILFGTGWHLVKGTRVPTPHPIFTLTGAQAKSVNDAIAVGLTQGVKAMIGALSE